MEKETFFGQFQDFLKLWIKFSTHKIGNCLSIP